MGIRYMNNLESPQPPPSPSDEAIIRDMMDKQGISFEDARRQWDTMKAKVDEENWKVQQEREEDNENG